MFPSPVVTPVCPSRAQRSPQSFQVPRVPGRLPLVFFVAQTTGFHPDIRCRFDHLNDSVVGTVLRALTLALNRSEYNEKETVVSPLLEPILNLISSVESINQKIAAIRDANTAYLIAQHNKKIER